MSAKRAYITGASGLIGKETVRAFCDAGWSVTATDIVKLPLDGGLSRADWKIERAEDVSAGTLKGVDALIHLAALTLSAQQKSFGAEVDLPDARPMLGLNVLGTESLFRAAAESGLPCVAWASAGGIYGQPTYHTYLEGRTVQDTGPFRPLSLYAHTKLMCEGIASFYAASSSTQFIGLRPTFSYGLGRLSGISGMFAEWIAQAIRGEKAVLGHPFGLAGQLQLIYVKDMAQAFVDAAVVGTSGKKDLKGVVYNSPTRQILPMGEILRVVRATTGNENVHVAEQGPFAPEIQMPTMATSEAFDILGSVQRYPLDESIRDMAKELNHVLPGQA
jgi:UDP-glucose 4-epimerase